MSSTGSEVLLEVLRSEGVRHLFGNPGSTELPLMDALAGADDLHYVLALQEATAVGMADGYAQVTGRPAFLNLHTSAGLGNAVGNLTNAQVMGTPLVVTAGQQHYGHIEADPLLAGDLVGLARPVSKWAHEVRTRRELGTILRRAFADAARAPTGPVFVSLPMSTLDETAAEGAPPPSPVQTRSVPADLDELVDLLTEPAVGRLAIVAGREVASSGAVGALVDVAEALGAPVYGSPLHGLGVFPPGHALHAGALGMSAAEVRAELARYDRVFLVGSRAFMAYPYTEGSPLPTGTDLVQLAPDPHVARTHPVRLGLVADPRSTLTAVLPLLRGRVDGADVTAALSAATERRRTEDAAREDAARARYGPAPLDPAAAAHAVLRAMPAGTAVVDEAITTGAFIRGFHRWTEPGRYFFCEGGGLGWGMPAAVGVSLAYDRAVPVLCAVGDGSALYSPQALWTAAHEQLPVVFAVFVNRQYLILKSYLRRLQGESVRTGRFLAMDIDDPPVDYVALATGLGVDATHVDHAGDVGDVVKAALAAGRPHLVEIPVAAP